MKVAFDAVQEATTSAVTLPELSIAIPETVTPCTVDELPPSTVTVKDVGGSSLSLTVAICELELAAPCWREIVAAVIVGAVLFTKTRYFESLGMPLVKTVTSAWPTG